MIAKLEGHRVLNNKQGPNTEPPQTMGATINNESTSMVCYLLFCSLFLHEYVLTLEASTIKTNFDC